jgi:hypothetical protein
MPLVRLVGRVTREQIRAAHEAVYVFGDNMAQRGLGGMAREARGEPNTIGIPTKWGPSTNARAYFSDVDLKNIKVATAIADAFDEIENHLKSGTVVYYPAAGVGSGLALLEDKAPAIKLWIDANIQRLETRYG